MRVSIVSALSHPKYGGPAEVVRSQVKQLSCMGVDAQFYGLYDSILDFKELSVIFPGSILFKTDFPGRWFYSKQLRRSANEIVDDTDVFHLHMFWDFPVWLFASRALSLGKPYVITPHGSLNGARKKRVHKIIYRNTFLKKILDNDLGVVHCLNEFEREQVVEAGINLKTVVIPNGISLTSDANPCDLSCHSNVNRNASNSKLLIYLGRVSEGKGLEILLDAWSKLDFLVREQGWSLVIAGPDYRGYKGKLLDIVDEKMIHDIVYFIDPVYGEDKWSLLSNGTCFVLPSRSEGFSMALLEASLAGLPSVFSSQCHFEELSQYGGGWCFDIETDQLINVIKQILLLSNDELLSRGNAAQSFVRSNYSLSTVCKSFSDLYRSLV